ncbi:MAG: PH domain-containing protein, partial [Acidimicrobiia bacterium]
MTAPEPPAGADPAGAEPERADDVPQVAARRLHPFSPLVSGLFLAARSWPVALLLAARGGWLPMLVIAVSLVVWRWLVWLRTSYGIGSDGLTVRSGIIWRNIQVVPPQRVQQVEVHRQLRHRVIGLAVIRIGLAGGGAGAQVDLDALSEQDAADLADTLERWRGHHRNGTNARSDAIATTDPSVTAAGQSAPSLLPPPARPPLLQLTAGQLVVGGLTSRSLWLAPFVALAAAVQLVDDSRLVGDSTDTV